MVGEMALVGEGVGTGDNCLLSNMLKKLISRQTLGYFSRLDLTQTFE